MIISLLSIPLSIIIGMLFIIYSTTPVPAETHPYDRCVQLLGKYAAKDVNPVQVEMLIDSCLKKRERNSK